MKTVEEIISEFDVFCERSIYSNKINHSSGGTIDGVIEYVKLLKEKLEILNKELTDKANEFLVENPDIAGLKDELLKTAKSRIEQFISENK